MNTLNNIYISIFLQIYEGNDLLKKQNSTVARFVSSLGSSLRVRFTSDAGVTGKGFNASYYIQSMFIYIRNDYTFEFE